MAGDFGMDPDEAVAEFERATGLSVPEDVEALGGDFAALAFDSEVDPSAFEDEDITRVPVGLVIQGDPEAIEAALDKIRGTVGDDAELLLSRTEGDRVFVSADADYLDRLVAGGDLGDSDTYQGIVENEAAAATLFFVDFDAGDGWLEDLVSSFGEEELVENVRPLRALGVMTWHDDDAEHTLIKLTTE
jgi:hypothetical protein